MTPADDDAAVAAGEPTTADEAVAIMPRPLARSSWGAAGGHDVRAGWPRWLAPVGDATASPPTVEEVADRAAGLGLRRVDLVAWRDLDDPEAGGSELHAHEVAARWAAAGLQVHMATSAVRGMSADAHRSGYAVHRRWGRYAVFPATALHNLRRRRGPDEAVVEIWNGMPFLSPLWARCPRVVFLHHVHAEMWGMVLPPALAGLGNTIERRLAPPLYRRSRVVTLSGSSRKEIVDLLGLHPDQVTVVPPGVDARFGPGGRLDADPLVVAVGRLVPVKRFDKVVAALADVRTRHPRLQAVIVGEGYERPRLQAQVQRLGASTWLTLPGRLGDAELVELYRRSWALVSMSQREGWGMTITEAAACGTPAVVSRIAGHVDAVEDGRTGVLVDDSRGLVAAVSELLADPVRRERLSRGARERARRLTWDATAAATLQVLVDEVAVARRSDP